MNTTIRQRENGLYQAIISYKVNGAWKQTSKGGFERVSDAKKWAKDKSFDLVEIERQGIIDSDITVGELFDVYIDNLVLLRRSNSRITCIKTTKNFFAPFSDTKVKNLNAFEVKKHIINRQKATGYSYKSMTNFFISILNFAVKELKVLYTNPIESMKIDFEKRDKREKFITKEVYESILQDLPRDIYKLYIRTLYETGMRKNELMGLTIFDIKDGYIKVNQQLDPKTNTLVKLKTKNSYRTIPINKDLEKDLLSQIPNIDGRIFYDFCSETVYKYLKKYKASLHCFRHTFATNLVSSGIDLTIASQIIGDNIKTILNIYTQVNEDKKKNEYNKVRAIF